MKFEEIKTNLNKKEMLALQAKGLFKDIAVALAKLLVLGLVAFFLYNNSARLWFVITRPDRVDYALTRSNEADNKAKDYGETWFKQQMSVGVK